MPILVRAVLVWLLMMAVETLQGLVRRALFGPEIELIVRQGSVIAGVAVIFLIAWFSRRWLRLHSNAGALAVGLVWVGLTIAFEVLVGRALHLSWEQIASDYDLRRGGLMPLGLLAMALTPLIVRRLSLRHAHA